MARERRDFDAAEAWHLKSLKIGERLGNELGAASAYHQIGMVAQQRRDFGAAEAWYRKSLEIRERLGDEHGAAQTYHQLGTVAQERRDWGAAEAWYRKSLEIKERLGDEHGATSTYHQLGVVAQWRHDFDAAEAWYHKVRKIRECVGDEPGAARTYGQLGKLAVMRHDFDAAEAWLHKSLKISERLNLERETEITRRRLNALRAIRQHHDISPVRHKGPLSDERAIELLNRFLRALPASTPSPAVAALRAQALATALSLPGEPLPAPTPGALARAALMMLASDPQFEAGIAALVADAGPRSFAADPKTLDVSGLLHLLETQVQRPPDWPQELTGLARSLAQQLFAYAGWLPATPQSDAEVRVWYATTRRPLDPGNPSAGYGAERDECVHYGQCRVFVPRWHLTGSLGSPWWKRLLTMTDDRLRLLAIERVAEQAFWTGVSEHLAGCALEDRDALVFIHGFNVSFEQAALRAA